jgi:hypothetical protein
MDDEIKFVTNDQNLDGTEQKMLTDPGYIEITGVEQLKALAEAAVATKNFFDASIKPKMTAERAKRIRQLRVELGQSWRGVASMCAEEWGDDAGWEPPSNQLAGMSLCEFAAEMLGEHYRESPWN